VSLHGERGWRWEFGQTAPEEAAVATSKYSRVEREQRWLLRSVPVGARGPAEILDRYLTGTTLRLRQVTSADGEVVRKLGQKVRDDPRSPSRVQMTNIYLQPHEHALLAALPGAELRKTRRHIDAGGRAFAIDELHGPLEGLILAEVELEAGEPDRTQPSFAFLEVTEDDRFSGGRLAHATDADIAALRAVLARPG
jgi:CYTH domain-containing protein